MALKCQHAASHQERVMSARLHFNHHERRDELTQK